MTIYQWIELILTAVIVVGAVIYYSILAIKNKWISKLYETIKTNIADAEKLYPTGQGNKKKEFVLQAVIEKCKELGIPYDLLKKLISTLIDKIVADYNIIKKS